MTRKLFNWASACIAAAIAFVLPIAAMAANAPTATVSGTSVTISNESGAEGWDNASISDMSGYQGNNFTIPAIGSDLPSDTILKITSVSIAKSTSRTYMPDKLGLSGCVSAYRTITAGGFTSAAADKYTYSFADTDCLVKVGTASPVRFFQNSGAAHNSEIAFRLGSNAYQFIASIVWGGKVPIIEIQAEIVSGHIDESLTPIYETGNDRVYLSGAYGWIKTADDSNHSTAELYLVDGDYGFGFKATDANSLDGNNKNRFAVWEKLSGPGTLTAYNSGIRTPALKIYDSSGFTGSIATTGGSAQIFTIFCNDDEDSTFDNDKFYNAYYDNNKGCIYISAGRTTANGRVVTIAEGATWTAPGNIFNKGELVVNGTAAAKIVNDGTLTVNGTVSGSVVNSGSGTVIVNAGASIPGFGSQRDFSGWTIGSTVAVSIIMTSEEYGKGSVSITGASGISSITVYAPDGTTSVGTITPDGTTGEGTLATGVKVSGLACWCDYEFNGSLASIGKDTTALEDDASSYEKFYDNKMLYTYTHPWRNISYPDSWTAVVRCTVPELENAAVVMFGTYGAGAIGLIAGPNPETDMLLVSTPGSSATTSEDKHFTTLQTMSVQNATAAQHVYVFTKSGTTVNVYCDGDHVLTDYALASGTLGGGLQVGSLHGGVVQNNISTGVVRFGAGEQQIAGLSEAQQKNARIDCMRMYNYILSAEQIAQLSVEFPAVKLYRATVADGATTDWGSLTWTPAWDGGNAYSKIILTVEGDATLTLPASITAEDFQINVDSGKTLALVKASGGTTFTLGNPMEVNGGAVAVSELLGFGNQISGTGTLRLCDGVEVGRALSGTAKVEIPSGATVTVTSGGEVANTLTGAGTLSCGSLPGALSFGDWTGTVVLPSFDASSGVNFNDYGKSGSTVEILGMTAGWIKNAGTTVAPALKLSGNMSITAMSSWTYTFAEIDGSGNLSFALTEVTAPVINITKVAAGYSGTISNTTGQNVTITTLDRAAGTPVTAGSKVLSTSGNVSASALTLAGLAQSVTLFTQSDGIYVAAASVQKGSNPVTYHASVAAALTEAGSDAATITLLSDTDANIKLYAGQTLANGARTSGTVTCGTNGYELVNNNGTYTLVDNTASTWTDASGDHKWNTAANWSTGYCPSQYTSVTFPASNSAHVVILERNSGDPRHYCASMALNGDVEFQRDANEYVQVYPFGNVTGSGTLTFIQTGFKLPDGGETTISCPVVCNALENDNFFAGSSDHNETFTFSGAVDVVAGELKADYSHLIFNGPVTIHDGASVKSNHESADTMFNGGIIVPEGAAASLTVVNGGGQHTIASTVTLASGATFTIPNGTVTNTATFVTSAEGCYVNVTTSGGNIVYTVEQLPPSVEIGEATFDYGADYTNATVTVAVTETNASGVEYTLTVDGTDYTTNAVDGTVTFENVAVARGNDIYAPIAYTIAATSGETTISTAGGSSIVADGSVWFEHNSTGLFGGSWSNAVDLTTPADVTDNTFTPTATPSSNDVVVLEFDVCFKSVSDEDAEGDVQAAIKIGDVNDTPVFMVLTNGNLWATVSAQGITPDPAADYKVVLTLNYTTHTYGATVNGVDLKDEQNSAVFSMAKSTDIGANSLEFRGTGTLTSMKGEKLEGNMVASLMQKYATVDDAIAAYSAGTDTGPFVVLHAGTAPAGWTITDGVSEDTLSCTAAAKTVSGGVTIYYDTLQGAIDVNALDTASLSGEPAATPTNIVLLAANTEDVTLPVDKTVVIDATPTTPPLSYKEPVCVENGDYTFEATTNEYNVATYSARNWYQWTLSLANANGATVTGIENGTNVTEKSPTVTFTVAPAANYHMVSVTAQPEGGEVETLTADNGTYSYTFGTNATITVNTAIDTYTVTFVDEDGTTVLKAATAYDYGTATNAIVQPETPTKAADELYTYAFAGWTPTLAEVTANAIYTATYTPVLRSYEITIPDVANTTVSVAYVTGGVAANATAAGNITVDAGTSLTATWTAASGYKITSGGTQTINPVAAAQTLASPIVEALGATVSGVAFDYGDDYATATVTANVSGDATSATLSYGGETYSTNVVNGTVTFENVAVARGNDIYAPIAYTIAAKSGETTISTTGGSSIVADGSVWFEHNSTGLIGGSWATEVDLTTPADVTDNTFTPTATPSSNDVVVLEFDVSFQSVSDEDIVDDAQAAIKIGDVNDTPAFMVLTNGNLWATVSAQGITPDPAATNKVVLTLNYTTHTYGATVDGVDLKDEQNSAVFSMAKSGDTGVNSLEFRGTGTLASMKGEQLDGNMVVDKNGTKYATIDAAIAAYNQDNAIGPLTMLHAGTAPFGWTIANGELTCTAAAMTVSGGVTPVTTYYATLQDAIDAEMVATVQNQEPLAIILLASNDEVVMLDNGYKVAIDATASLFTYNAPTPLDGGDYAIDAVGSDLVGNYTVTYTARDWYEWTLTLVNANGATVTGIENGTNVTEKSPTVTFTVEPADGYSLDSVTAQVADEDAETLVASDGTYSYTLTNAVTITVNTVYDFVTLTVPLVANTDVIVTTNDVAVDGVEGDGVMQYTIRKGTPVTVAYSVGERNYYISTTHSTSVTYQISAGAMANDFTLNVGEMTVVAIVAAITRDETVGEAVQSVTRYYESLRAAVAASIVNDTITLLADDNVSFSASNLEITIDKALTIDGNGHAIYGVNNYAGGNGDHDIYIVGDGDVTIKNVTLANFAGGVSNNMRTYPIWTGSAYAGTLTLDNVTVQNFNRTAFNLNGGTVVVTNCTITGDTTKEAYFQEGIGVYNANVTIVDTAISNVGSNLEKEDSQIAACIQLGNPNGPAVGTGSITVVSGTYSGEYGIIVASNAQNSVSVQGGTFNGDLMVEEGEGGTIVVSGGLFDRQVPAEFAGANLAPTTIAEGGKYTVKTARTVTFEVDNNVVYTNLVVADGEPVAAPDPAPTKDNSTFRAWQTNGVDWVFTDAVTSDIILVADWTPNNVDVTVPEKTGFTIRVTVNGDEYNTYTTENGIRTYSVPYGSNVVVTYTIDGAYIVADGATTTFAYDSIAENKAIGDSAPTAVAAVAQIGNGYYATLRSAVSAAQAGDTIVLLTNDDESFSASNLEITIDKALTIDGNGHAIYGVNNYAGGNGDHDIYIVGDGDVTIKNVTLANFAGGVSNNMRTYPIWTGSAYAGTLTLDNVTVQNFNRTAFNLNGGTVVVTNCTITGDTTKEAYFQEGIGVYNANVTIVDTAISNVGSNLEKEDSQIAACIQLGNPNGPTVGTGSITVVSGTYSGEYGIIVASNAQNSVSVQGGTFNGDLMVEEGEGGNLSISGGTFSVAIDPDYCAEGLEPYGYGDGRYTVRINLGWIYEAADHPGYTGSWSNEVAYSEGKITLTDGNTYTASQPSDGRMVTVELTMSFDDVNDDDEDVGAAKAAVKLGSGGFKVYTSEGPDGAVTSVWKTVAIDGLDLVPVANQDYTFLVVLDMTNKTYTASLVTNSGAATNALTLAGSANIPFASRENAEPVQKIEFVGSGTVTSIFGNYEDREVVLEFVDGQKIESVTLNAAQAAWLNGQDSYDALAAKIATMAQKAFDDAYLLNLDILSAQYDGTYSFKVTGITVDDTKVTVTVELVRTAALNGGINGTLKLNGGATLPASGFTTLQSVTIGDEDFSEGNSTTCIFTKGEGGEKFFRPVIVQPTNE